MTRLRLRAGIRLAGMALVLAIALYAFPGSTEVDTQVFAINVGFDMLPDGMLRLTVQMPSGEADSSGSSGGGQQQSSAGGSSSDGGRSQAMEQAKQVRQQSMQSGYIIATADGVNYADTLNMMTATLPRILNLSQVEQLVFSQQVAESEGFYSLLSRLVLDNEFYNAAEVVVCRGSAEEFLHEQNLILGARLSKAQDAATHAHLLVGTTPSTQLVQLYNALHSGYGDGAVALCATNLFAATTSSTGDASGTVYAGDTARTGASLNEYMGSALFNGRRMVGMLTGYETQLLHILRGTLSSMLMMDDGLTAQLTQRSRPRVSVALNGAEPRVDVHVELYMQQHLAGVALDTAEARLTEELTALIAKCQQLGVEPFGFGALAVRQFPTFAKWNDFDWRSRFAQASVSVQVKLITSGT